MERAGFFRILLVISQIVNCYTYTLVQLLVGSETLQVKVPTACPE
jgi:hypothetical protein